MSNQHADYRPAQERIKDWNEINLPTDLAVTSESARHCMDCGVAFCQSHYGCPVENKIPDWNQRVEEGRWQEALRLLHSTNNFPEFTGRLCPAPCQSACVLGINSDPVEIRSIEWQIIERGFQEGWVRPQIATHKTGKRVAIIGSGPAGLAAAQQLVRLGHAVTVFEKSSHLGGLLRHGIPDFKMEKWRIDRRLEQLSAEGVQFKTSTCVGKDISFEELQKQFHAVGLALGAEEPRTLAIPGHDLDGVHFAMDYLVEQNEVISGKKAASNIYAKNKRVIILGGGDTGSDCLGTALRQGAKEVLQFEILPKPSLARSSETPWPEWPLQLKSSHAHEEGGTRDWSLSTKAFLGNNGKVEKLIAERILWKDRKFEKLPGPELEFEVDLVLLALGFQSPSKTSKMNFEYSERGIKTDTNMMTSEKGIFAAGDLRRGASLIVWAIAEGRSMASAIHSYLHF